MPRLLQKIVLMLLSFLLLVSSNMTFFVNTVKAEPSPSLFSTTTTWYKQDFPDWYTKVYDTKNPSEIFGERYTAAQVEWILYSLFAFILNHVSDGNTTTNCIGGDAEACTAAITQAIQALQSFFPEGYLEDKNQSLASMIFSKRDFSGIGYVQEKLEKFSLVPEAKAQTGFGYGALDPIKDLWSVSRNFAYALSVLAVIVLAFMIMFRVKISPQIVISVQSALPKIIAALVLATFSYAIAGFLVDLMYLVIGLISVGISGGGDPSKVFVFMTEGFLGLGFLGLMLMYFILFFGVLLFNLFASGNLIINLTPPITAILLTIFILIVLIVAIILLFMFFKILWILLKTLAQIYLLTILAPIQIILGTFSQNMGFGTWIKSLAANLAVYPVVGTLFGLAMIFLAYSVKLGLGSLGDTVELLLSQLGFKNLPTSPSQWVPPLTLGIKYLPLIFVGVSFVIMTLIPKAIEIIQGFMSGKPFAYGTALGMAIGPVKNLAGFGMRTWGQRESELGESAADLAIRDRNAPPGALDQAKARIKRGVTIKSIGTGLGH